ncbi:MAG: hypothetical protein JNJ54_13475 [Myxococcaceae bacterium]|nr:hypothetical protein [Myxococcaceae bacterium]
MNRLRPALAALHIAFGVLAFAPLVAAAIVFGGLSGLVGAAAGEPAAGVALGTLLVGAILLAGVIAAVSITAGVAVWLGKPWGDALMLVASALHLLNFPVGTALALFGAWVVLVKEPTGQRSGQPMADAG